MLGVVLELGDNAVDGLEEFLPLVAAFAYFGEEIAQLRVAELHGRPFGLDRLQEILHGVRKANVQLSQRGAARWYERYLWRIRKLTFIAMIFGDELWCSSRGVKGPCAWREVENGL